LEAKLSSQKQHPVMSLKTAFLSDIKKFFEKNE
jgi:hypothetical protein